MDLRLPITYPILHALLKSLESLLQGYDRALFQSLFLFAFYAYARIGELTVLRKHLSSSVSLQDIVFMSSQKQIQEVKVTFRHFKHNTSGAPHFISFQRTNDAYCPVTKLIDYVHLRGNKAGPLFCTVMGKAILRSTFDDRLRAALQFCGLSDHCYKGHSFRIGKATYDAQNNIPDSIIRLRGRWKSDAFKKYIRVCTN